MSGVAGVASTTIAMLLGDARLPSGGHAHSAGMEPAFLAGVGHADVRALLAGRARTSSLVEAGAAVVAMRVLSGAPDASTSDRSGEHAARADLGPGNGNGNGNGNGKFGADRTAELAAVEGAWAARTPSKAQREASRRLGRGLLRLAKATWPDEPAITACAALPDPSRAIVLGAIGAACGMNPAELVRAVVYDDAQSAAAAVLKLDPVDPARTVRWVLDACEAAEPFVAEVAACDSPDAIPAAGAPEAEGWAEAHNLLTRRLFRA
ncbi:MAG TPA: urease accessory UreF family protein [Candidatus Lumbricidophila sp.]|nr:urease accessory UreF family protein [Candidatus Lumbricidophila sp.]